MKRHAYLSLSIGFLVVGAVLISNRLSSANRASSVNPSTSRARAAAAYGHLPLHLEANQGQTDPQVEFLARGIGHTLFLTASEAVLVLTNPNPAPRRMPTQQRAPTTALVLRMTFVGANPRPRVAGLGGLPRQAKYFIGDQPPQRHRKVPLYAHPPYHHPHPPV